jgi:polysaccharide pyruvyl transferase WcaK-like protein
MNISETPVEVFKMFITSGPGLYKTVARLSLMNSNFVIILKKLKIQRLNRKILTKRGNVFKSEESKLFIISFYISSLYFFFAVPREKKPTIFSTTY